MIRKYQVILSGAAQVFAACAVDRHGAVDARTNEPTESLAFTAYVGVGAQDRDGGSFAVHPYAATRLAAFIFEPERPHELREVQVATGPSEDFKFIGRCDKDRMFVNVANNVSVLDLDTGGIQLLLPSAQTSAMVEHNERGAFIAGDQSDGSGGRLYFLCAGSESEPQVISASLRLGPLIGAAERGIWFEELGGDAAICLSRDGLVCARVALGNQGGVGGRRVAVSTNGDYIAVATRLDIPVGHEWEIQIVEVDSGRVLHDFVQSYGASGIDNESPFSGVDMHIEWETSCRLAIAPTTENGVAVVDVSRSGECAYSLGLGPADSVARSVSDSWRPLAGGIGDHFFWRDGCLGFRHSQLSIVPDGICSKPSIRLSPSGRWLAAEYFIERDGGERGLVIADAASNRETRIPGVTLQHMTWLP